EVALVHRVEVDDSQRPDPCCCQLVGRRRAEPSGPDQENLRLQELELSRLPHFRDGQVAAVAPAIRLGENLRDRQTPAFAAPAVESARERLDAFIAEALEALRRQQRTVARGAIEDDGCPAIRE